jgi:serine/threonine protein phosphatase PrpC
MEFLRTFTAVEFQGETGDDRVEVFADGPNCVIALADGMGGHAGAAAAAEAFIASVKAARLSILDWLNSEHWYRLLRSSDKLIQGDGGGETTAVVAAVTPDGVAGASVGDSGAWIVTADRMFDLTAAQMRKPGLGSGQAAPLPFRAGPLDGTLLVASDGLFKYATPAAICDCVRNGEFADVPRRLVDAVRMKSGKLQDDVAVAVARWVDDEGTS